MTERHPVLVKATGRTERRGFVAKQEHKFHHDRVLAGHPVGLPELLAALAELDTALTADDLPMVDRAELAADFEDVSALIGNLRRPTHCWAVVTTYDPSGTFRPGVDVVWSGHFLKGDAEAALPRWDKHLNRPADDIRVEWRTDVRVYQIKKTEWEGPYR